MYTTNNYCWGYATTLEERLPILRQHVPLDGALENLVKWRKRKTLLNDSDFNTMLFHKNLTHQDFNLSLTPLSPFLLRKLLQYVKVQPWYLLHEKIFTYKTCFEPSCLETALRFHVNYYQKNIKKFLKDYDFIRINKSCLKILGDYLLNDLMSIAKRTLVWDIHTTKDKIHFTSNNPEQDFIEYLQYRFYSSQDTKTFFLDYPTLSRLLSERLMFALENFKILLQSLSEASSKIERLFCISKPFLINKWIPSKGDSHNYGKTTTILEINQKPLVFKYHNNNSLLSFNKLLSFIEKKQGQVSFYKIICISGENYCFEEYIEQSSCNSTNEIEAYYRNYGKLVALAYWLGSCDLHMENLIAKGPHPVLIDVETIFRAEERRHYDSEYSKSDFFEANSVITTGLLPMKKYWNRQIDFSALNGMKQKLPFKVRKLINENTTNIKFHLEEEYLQVCKNIPMLDDISISYDNFISFILDGYKEMIDFLIKNKNDLLKFIEAHFHHIQMRVLLRDSQDYQNFIDFSTHPSCMVDYIEREKIFENLWSNSFINEGIVSYEIESVLKNDLPYFVTYTDSKSIYIRNFQFKNYFTTDMIHLWLNRAQEITPSKINFSMLLLEESLDFSTPSKQIINIPENNRHITNMILRNAANIAELILQQVIIDKKNKKVLWADLIRYNKNTFTLSYPDTNLYNGTAGLFLFFYFLSILTSDTNFIDMREILEEEVFTQPVSSAYSGGFHGVGCRITVAFIAYRFNKEKKYLSYLLENLEEALNNVDFHSWEWINGKASLISVLSSIYNELSIPLSKKLLIKLTKSLSDIDYSDFGFAHGYSGILFALLRANKILSNSSISKKILTLVQKFAKEINSSRDLYPSWCHGTTGINRILEEIKNDFPEYDFPINCPSFTHEESCICHGRFGDISALLLSRTTGKLSDTRYENAINKLLNTPIELQCYHSLISLGLFNGLSGIGYQLLRILEPEKILDILFL